MGCILAWCLDIQYEMSKCLLSSCWCHELCVGKKTFSELISIIFRGVGARSVVPSPHFGRPSLWSILLIGKIEWSTRRVIYYQRGLVKMETSPNRPERWIVTILSSNQWLATIENHWKTIVSNGCQTTKPLKNHWYQWFSDQKPLENHCYQWFWRLKTIVKPLTSMVAFQPFI